MLKFKIKDKNLSRCLNSYCMLMNIKPNDFVTNTINDKLLNNIGIIEDNLNAIGISTKDIINLDHKQEHHINTPKDNIMTKKILKKVNEIKV